MKKKKSSGSSSARLTARPRTADSELAGRERILVAAIRAFSEVGYEGATTAGIARAAGVAQPLVHHHFGSKDGLWQAAIDAVFSKIPSLPAPGDESALRGALIEIVEQTVRFVAANPEATRIIAREGAAPSARLDYLLKKYLHQPFREVVDLLRAAQMAGVVSREIRPELCLFLILGAASHLFDVGALAERSQGIDTSTEWTRDAFTKLMRTLLEDGLLQGKR